MTDRLALAIPVDVSRLFDATVRQSQIDADAFLGSGDDRDTLASMIEDAADEFRSRVGLDFRLSRVGSAGNRETFEQVTRDFSGHEAFKKRFSHWSRDYTPQEATVPLANTRILPFDSSAGDAAYIYRGLGRGASSGGWEEITADHGDTWLIVDHVDGMLSVHPVELYRAAFADYRGVPRFSGALEGVRIAISYRYGALGGSRRATARTDLDATLSDTQTGTVSVTDGARLPGGTDAEVVFLIGTEYLLASPDPANDQIDIVERGVRGTQATSHSSGDTLTYTPPAIRKAVASRAAMSLITSGKYAAWLPDNEADVSQDDMLAQFEDTWETTVEVLS